MVADPSLVFSYVRAPTPTAVCRISRARRSSSPNFGDGVLELAPRHRTDGDQGAYDKPPLSKGLLTGMARVEDVRLLARGTLFSPGSGSNWAAGRDRRRVWAGPGSLWADAAQSVGRTYVWWLAG